MTHPLYQTWYSMLARCEKPLHASYHLYGMLGVRVCAEWHDLDVFAAAVGPRPPDPPGWREGKPGRYQPYYSLDRIDRRGNYEPGNVRWSTWAEQSAHRRRRH